MSSSPCVGIVIPIYNVQSYLKDCLNSVIHQTYSNLQIILVDDGSTDSSFSIAREYYEKDKRITLIKREKNGGMGAARNTALDYLSYSLVGGGGVEILEHSPCKSVEYIHFLDSDDWLELECIEECVERALSYDLDLLLYSGKDFVKEDFSEAKLQLTENHILRYFKNLQEHKVYSGLELLSSLATDYVAFSCGCQIKKELLENLRFCEGIMAEDALFAPLVLAKATRVGVLDKQYYKRLIRPFSITDFGNAHRKDTLPQSLSDIYAVISDDQAVKNYYLAYSCACICSVLHSHFLLSEKYDQQIQESIKALIRGRIAMAFYALHFEKDPRDARGKLQILESYVHTVGWGSKLAYHFPLLFRFFKKIKDVFKS